MTIQHTGRSVGEVYSLIGRMKVETGFWKSLAKNAVLLEEGPDNLIYKIMQAETFEKYAKLLSRLGRNGESKDYTGKSKEIYRKLAEKGSVEGDFDE